MPENDKFMDDGAFFAGMDTSLSEYEKADIFYCPHSEYEIAINDQPKYSCSNNEFFFNGIDILKDRGFIPVRGNTFFVKADLCNTLLVKCGSDNKKYFLYESDGFKKLHPFDSIEFHKKFISNRDILKDAHEFFYNGNDVLSGIKLDPWKLEKSTGEIQSFFFFNDNILHYQSNGKKFFLKMSENFEKHHAYEFLFSQTYGYKIKAHNGIWWYDIRNPKKIIYINNIASYNGTFIDIITYPKAYEENRGKYDDLKKTVCRIIADIIIAQLKCKKNEIYIPLKAISCVLKSNPDEMKDKSDFIKQNIDKFSRLINFGFNPDIEFYNCNNCASESVCMYKTKMTEFNNKNQTDQSYEDYKNKHFGQGLLFPEMANRR